MLQWRCSRLSGSVLGISFVGAGSSHLLMRRAAAPAATAVGVSTRDPREQLGLPARDGRLSTELRMRSY